MTTTDRVFTRLLAFLFVALAAMPALATDGVADKAQTLIHMLDYVGVDYPDTVKDGKIQNAGEYQEQKEFAGQVLGMLEQLPPVVGKDALVEKARLLVRRIDAKAAGGEVSSLARGLAGELILAYQVPVAPKRVPDLARAAALFQSQCVACHGSQGRGDGPVASGMDPAPSDFHDAARMGKRSIHGLYNTVTLGVGGTPMRAFTELSEADRWGLAFLVSGWRDEPKTREHGATLWKNGTGKAELGTLARLVSVTAADLAAAGNGDLDAVRSYLVANPQVLAAAGPQPLAVTHAKLNEALQAYRAGDRPGARRAAITAYLEGFELIETSLDNLDPALRRRTEEAMMALRSDIDAGVPVAQFEQRVVTVGHLIDDVGYRLSEGEMSAVTAFTSSLLILLREGLEAILVLAAIIAFVRKTGRHDALPYIHAGWVGAVVLGAATWFAANHFLTLSGASRELTEGVAAVLAAVMLLYVGLWLHNRSHAQAWQSFIREKVTGALSRQTLWAMAGISFLAVYRELFEVILFYETLLAQAGEALRPQVLGGIGVSAVILAIVGGVILKYSVRLPIGLFFSATSWLLVVMAVIFIGHGVAALQEAGVLTATPVAFVALPMLGLYPNEQGLAAQGAMLALTIAVLLAGRRSRRGPQP